MPHFFIIAIVVIIILVFTLTIYKSDWYKRKQIDELYNDSIGVFDEPAKEALALANTLSKPQPKDRLIRGQLLAYNVNNDINLAQRDREYALGMATEDFMGVLLGIDEMEAGNRGHALHAVEVFGDTFGMDILGAAVDRVDPIIRLEDTRTRAASARAEASNKAEAVDKYFEKTIVYDKDPQNVHDSALTNDLTVTLQRIKSSNNINRSPADCIKEANDYIINTYSRDKNNTHKVAAAQKALEIISVGNTIDKFKDTESGIFAHIWNRCKHPYNIDSSDNMKQAIVDSLADCIGPDMKEVCIMGRTARVINSLATLDYDNEVSDAAMTYNAYKNQILSESLNIINNMIDTARDSPDEKIKAVGDYFAGVDVEIDSDAEQEFIKNVKDELDINLGKYKHKLSPKELEKLRGECHAGIDI